VTRLLDKPTGQRFVLTTSECVGTRVPPRSPSRRAIGCTVNGKVKRRYGPVPGATVMAASRPPSWSRVNTRSAAAFDIFQPAIAETDPVDLFVRHDESIKPFDPSTDNEVAGNARPHAVVTADPNWRGTRHPISRFSHRWSGNCRT